MGRSSFSDQEIALYDQLKSQGLSHREIADRMPGRTIYQVRHLGTRLGNLERRSLVADGKIDWTDRNIAKLRELRATGQDVLQIARLMRTSYSAITSAISRFCPVGDAKLRRCLGGCDQMFPSVSRGNRLCSRCRAKEQFRCAA